MSEKMSKRRKRISLSKTAQYVLASFFGLVFALPLLFMMVSSFKPPRQIFSDLKSWRAFFPVGDVSLDQYVGVFNKVPVGQFLFNSIVISVTVVVLGLVVNSMAAFAIARLKFRGQNVLLVFVIATLIVPFETIALPMLVMVNDLPRIAFENGQIVLTQGWLNTYMVQIAPFIAWGFSIFLFVQYFKTIPMELDEAAIIDGAGYFRIYSRIIAPLAGPAFATSAILSFLAIWNAYLWPVMVVQQEKLRPVQVGLDYFFAATSEEGTAWGQIMAYSTLITVPIILVFIVFQRAFVASVASSGVKG
jgi:multiple sugar transport system permease protein